jgi:hypothetical protein
MQKTRVGGREAGMVLLTMLVVLVLAAGSSALLVWRMNQQQSQAGARMRAAIALHAAEAGVHRALAVLESVAPDGTAPRSWRPAAYSEVVRSGGLEGRFTVAVTDGSGGAILITSTGETGSITRRLRARVHLASPALLAGLYGAGVVHVERPPASLAVIPYGRGIGDRPWIHIAAGTGVVFATTDVSINAPGRAFEVGPGPLDSTGAAGPLSTSRPAPVRFLLARGAELTLGPRRDPVNIKQLRALGVYVEGIVLRSEALPALPEVDRTHYADLAAANTANAALNEAAGEYLGDAELSRKRDSLYGRVEFERLMAYVAAVRPSAQLRGVIYLRGGLSLAAGQHLRIEDGTLVAEGAVFLSQGALLEVTHSAATRTLPGLLVLDGGALIVTRQARLRAHGLVYASGMIDLGMGATIDIVGAVLGRDPEISFRNFASSATIRYDPAVLGTPGLIVPAGSPIVAWVAAWEEVP